MKTTLLQKIFISCLLVGSAQALDSKIVSSLILSPKIGSTIRTRTPVVAGSIKYSNGKQIGKKPVTIYVDGRKVATVKTNPNGVWSYQLKSTEQLSNGAHSIQASAKLCLGDNWAQGTVFYVQAADEPNIYKSGNVSGSNSTIIYPFADSYINDTMPTLIGGLLNVGFNPVSSETVILKLDGSTSATTTSDSNGIFSYRLTTPLSQGSHTLDAHCVQSSVDLTTINFTVDTITPDAPTIALPTANATSDTNLVTVSGTTQVLATITTFMDGNMYGEICYADESGNWSIEYTVEDGNHFVAAQATSIAGNQSPLSQATFFTTHEIMS